MYNETFVKPIRAELTSIGFEELRTAEDVEVKFENSKGTLLCVVNSICGCAAAAARPGVKMALENAKRPEQLTTVFAGQDREATERAREFFVGYPPSSPSVVLMKDGEIVYMLERHGIEGSSPAAIAAELKAAFDKFC